MRMTILLVRRLAEKVHALTRVATYWGLAAPRHRRTGATDLDDPAGLDPARKSVCWWTILTRLASLAKLAGLAILRTRSSSRSGCIWLQDAAPLDGVREAAGGAGRALAERGVGEAEVLGELRGCGVRADGGGVQGEEKPCLIWGEELSPQAPDEEAPDIGFGTGGGGLGVLEELGHVPAWHLDEVRLADGATGAVVGVSGEATEHLERQAVSVIAAASGERVFGDGLPESGDGSSLGFLEVAPSVVAGAARDVDRGAEEELQQGAGSELVAVLGEPEQSGHGRVVRPWIAANGFDVGKGSRIRKGGFQGRPCGDCCGGGRG